MGAFHLVAQVDTNIVLSLLLIECQESLNGLVSLKHPMCIIFMMYIRGH